MLCTPFSSFCNFFFTFLSCVHIYSAIINTRITMCELMWYSILHLIPFYIENIVSKWISGGIRTFRHVFVFWWFSKFCCTTSLLQKSHVTCLPFLFPFICWYISEHSSHNFCWYLLWPASPFSVRHVPHLFVVQCIFWYVIFITSLNKLVKQIHVVIMNECAGISFVFIHSG